MIRGSITVTFSVLLVLLGGQEISSFALSPISGTTRGGVRSRLLAHSTPDGLRQSVARAVEQAFQGNVVTDYGMRLWNETNVDARSRIANDRATLMIHQLQQLLKEDDVHASSTSIERKQVVAACDKLLLALEVPLAEKIEILETVDPLQPKKKKKQRSIVFGAAMGAVVAAWVFSGNYIFTGLFTVMTILGQLEYYRMVINTGVYPARRISVIGGVSMFLTALFTPNLHQICLPMFGLWVST
jgi:hypothetical protein